MNGTIDKRTGPQGTAYRVRVELSPDPITGKRRYRAETHRTKKDAEKRLREWVTEIERGTAVDSTKMTIGELVTQWLAVQRPRIKPRTCEHYEFTLKRHVAAHIGTTLVQKVRPITIDALYALLRDEGLSDHAVYRAHQRLRQIFDYAVKRYIVAVNPMQHVETPTMHSAPPTVLTAPQIQRFLSFARHDAHNPVWLLLLQTGLRRGEALGVRWRDLDLERGKLTVRQCVESLRGLPHIQTPKTAAAMRTISLFPESVKALHDLRKRHLQARLAATDWEENDLVFCTSNGRPLAPTNVLRSLRAIQEKANAAAKADEAELLPRFDIHDLRHSHASHLLREGWDIVRVSRRLGHANPGITMTIYAHAITDVRDDDLITPAAFAYTGTD